MVGIRVVVVALVVGVWGVVAGAQEAATAGGNAGGGTGGTVGSGPVKVTIAAKEAVANPLYGAWKGQDEHTQVTYRRVEQISGGAPMPGGGGRAATTSTVVLTPSKLTAEQAEIKVTAGTNAPETLTIPATLMADDPAFPKAAGKEELKIGDKTYACTKYTYTTNSKAEMGRDGQGLRGRVTVWVADGVPGGIVQRKISLTIRVTYEITDTLQGVLFKD